jgi:hypothetical protein
VDQDRQQKGFLPRPYAGERRIETARVDYRERQRRHHELFPDYENGWARPSATTANMVRALLLEAGGPLGVSDLVPGDVKPHEIDQVAVQAMQALVVVLDAAIQAGEDGRMLTTNLVFDAIAARWSDHYRDARERGPARVSWEMDTTTLKASWHDLRLNDIRLERLLPIVHQGCGLYTTKRSPGRGFTVHLTEQTDWRREQFIGHLVNDAATGGAYRRRGTSRRLLLADEATPDGDVLDDDADSGSLDDDSASTRKVVAGWAYNIAVPGASSIEVIKRLEATRLYVDAEVVITEAGRLEHRLDDLNEKLWDDYRVDVEKSNLRPNVEWTDPRTGKPGRVPTARERELRKKVGRQDKNAVAKLVEEYDQMAGQFRQMKPISDRLTEIKGAGRLDFDGEVEIRSRFAKLSNRRYQSLDFWPTEVSGKDVQSEVIGVSEQYDAAFRRTTSRRGRLFRIGASRSLSARWQAIRRLEAPAALMPEDFPDLADRQDLVGVDVSASQLQILAVFLGITKLEAQLQERPYKEIAAERAWQRDQNVRDPFKLPKGFDGARDLYLQESVKRAAMTFIYGSAPHTIARTLATSWGEYGPGLGATRNVNLFLEDQEVGFREIAQWFKPACTEIGRTAYKADRYAGVVFTDPYDGVAVRWNPVAWEPKPCAGADDVRIYAKVPLIDHYRMTPGKTGKLYPRRSWERAEPNAAGDYPVSRDKLYRMVGPCLTHMLDALFASLVIEELGRRGVQVISIHDSWIVPLDAQDDLAEAVGAAGEPWLRKLGVVYDDIAKYLPTGKYAAWISDRKASWAARVAGGDWPRFRVGPVRLVDMDAE